MAKPCFAEIETAALRDRVRNVQSGRPQVVSLGGGAFLSDENFELVSNNGVTVWLDCPVFADRTPHRGPNASPAGARSGTSCATYSKRAAPGYARADYRVEVIDDDTRSAVARILALPLF